MKPLPARPLSLEAYSPFGELLCARESPARSANQGSASVWDRLVSLENERASARLNVSVFRCRPRPLPLEVALLERHPHSTQLFVPMNARRFLVLVALGGSRPDLSTLQAFVAEGACGVSYRPGVWHHPMIALDSEIDFGCFVHEDGGRGDCEVVQLTAEERLLVTV